MGRFARYEFIQKIAVGGMAEVWSAWGVGADGSMTDVVVKRILPQFASDDSFQDMLLSEAEVTAHLAHPNIVAVLDWGHLDETCFLAMERVDGLDGRQLLDACAMRTAPIPPAVALHAIGEVFKGLDYAHRARDERGQPLGLVHRDVSPSNVLLSVTGEVKLADFGIARAKSRASHTVAGQVRGKPRYMSPEQAKGEELDGRSDLFAAGLVLHELLTGQPVFPASTYLEEVVALIQKGVPPPSRVNPEVPRELDALVLRLCERDLAKRAKSGAAAYDLIGEWAAKHRMRLQASGVAELVTSIVRPTQQKKPAEARGETRIVRVDDVDGVARFTTQGKILDPDFLATTTPGGRAPPIAPRASPSGRMAAPIAPKASPSGRMSAPIAPKASPSGRMSAPAPRNQLERDTDPPMPATSVMQMPASSNAVPEDDGPTNRRAAPAREPVGAIEESVPVTRKRPPTSGGRGITGGVSAAIATAIAIAIWWVASPPRALVQTGDPLDDAPVPTLALVQDPSLTAPTPDEVPEETPELAAPTATRRPRASPTASATATATAAPVIKAGTGFLNLRAKPDGEVTIDGEWAGSTPISKHPLPSGVHTVSVTADDGRHATQQVTILADETASVTLTLKAP